MKKLLLLLSFLLIFSCTSDKTVFWCGDHACINKKEKEAYFKKTMTVEVKKIGNKNKKKYSDHEKILQQTKIDKKKEMKSEKKILKELKLEEKMRIKEDKKIAKKLKLEEKMRIKKEKNIAKQLRLEEKKRIIAEKKLLKEKEKKKMLTKKITSKIDEKNSSTVFSELKQKIIQKNLLKPYPDINDIKN